MNISTEIVILIVIGVIAIAFILTERYGKRAHSSQSQLEVYVIYPADQTYGVSPEDAGVIASAMNAQVATFEQLSAAQRDGAQWCTGAWVTKEGGTLQAWYPMQYLKTAGVCGGSPLTQMSIPKAAVTLYGLKPSYRSVSINGREYIVVPWYQRVVASDTGKERWSQSTIEGYRSESQPLSKSYFNPHRDYETDHPDCVNGEVHCLLSDGTEGRCNLHNICSPHFSKFSSQPGGFVTMPRV